VTLRLRLLLVLVGIVTVGLVAADVAIYTSLGSYLYSQVDQQLTSDVNSVIQAPQCQGASYGRFGESPGVIPPPGLWAEVRDQSGTLVCDEPGYPLSPPDLPTTLPVSTSSSGATLLNVKCVGGASVNYRVLVVPVQVEGGTGTAVVAIPLNDLHHTLGRLILIEVLTSGAVIVVLGALAWWIVRRGLRPLDQMASTAGAIAAGDLSQRVESTDERTEVGQLGSALNTMLSGIEGAFAARAASEERLRRFLADASHELRTPLTSIRGYAELFDRGARDRPEDLATSMRHIREEASRMSTLVDDLLLLARLDHQRPLVLEHVDLTDIVTAAVDAARVSTPGRAITLEVPGPLPVVGDADRLRQVVDNLLANAVQHTPDGSPVDVRVGTQSATGYLEISDQGPGIPSAEQAHIFEPFHRADPTRARATGGAGLGLTIVSAIAHAHGGTVGVVSDPTSDNGSGGATFWVRIPLTGPAPEAGPGAAGGAEPLAPTRRGPANEHIEEQIDEHIVEHVVDRPDAPRAAPGGDPQSPEHVAAGEDR
jgi:two-component system OmpR family sensor kinase